MFGEMLNQIPQNAIRKPAFIRPGSIPKDTREGIRVGLFNCTHRVLQGFAEVSRLRTHIIPMRAFWNFKAVFDQAGIILISFRFRQCLLVFLIKHVAKPLVE